MKSPSYTASISTELEEAGTLLDISRIGENVVQVTRIDRCCELFRVSSDRTSRVMLIIRSFRWMVRDDSPSSVKPQQSREVDEEKAIIHDGLMTAKCPLINIASF